MDYVGCIANASANLEIVLPGRERCEEAKKMHIDSPRVESQLNSLEGTARQFFNPNRPLEQMGDLEEAGKMVFKSKSHMTKQEKGAMANYVESQIHRLKNI